jgi:tetratricopeptide (TPR) repeat protein
MGLHEARVTQIDRGREWVLIILGEDEAAAAVRRSIEVDSQSITHHEYLAYESGNQADQALLQGHVPEALALAERFMATGVDPYLGNLIVARCAFRMGDVARARAAVEAVDAAPRKGRTVEAKRLALRAALAAMEGHQQTALEAFDEAFRAFRDLGLLLDLAWYQLDMVAVLGGTPQAAAVAAEARAAFESMGAYGLAGQVETLTVGQSAQAGARRTVGPAVTPTEVA